MQKIKRPCDKSFRISQRFGQNPDIYKQFGLKAHNGIDHSVPVGTPIIAVAKGVVKAVKFDPDGYGHYIRLQHKNFETVYAHSDQIPFFQFGDTVETGETIMLSGNTGFSTGPHLHFGLRETDSQGNVINYENGYKGYIDPQPWIDMEELVYDSQESIDFCVNKGIFKDDKDLQRILSPVDIEAVLFNSSLTMLNEFKGLTKERWGIFIHKLLTK